jgi:predicted NUDIX family NTP pyrophosphohydrolase
MKQSSGTLLYRYTSHGVQVLLVHASGNYNRHAPWGIPKGWPEEGEDLETAARRETREETGVVVGSLQPLGYIDYTKSRKRVHAFAGEAPADAAPKCASWEIDAAEFLSLAQARDKIHPDQAPFLDRLEALLAES